MSKTTVKKAIAEFTPEQLRGLILDIYSKYTDVKEFLDFYSAPDLNAVHEKYSKAIAKEIYRIHRRMAAPRMSRIRKELKKFALLEPGFESEAELMIDTAVKLIGQGSAPGRQFSDMTVVRLQEFIDDTCEMLERNGMLDRGLRRLVNAVESINRNIGYREYFYNVIYRTLKIWIEKNEE